MATYNSLKPTQVKKGYGSNSWTSVSSGGTYAFGRSGTGHWVTILQFKVPTGVSNITGITLYVNSYSTVGNGYTTQAKLNSATPNNATTTTPAQWLNHTALSTSTTYTGQNYSSNGSTLKTVSYTFSSGLSSLTAGKTFFIWIYGTSASSYSEGKYTSASPYINITYSTGSTTPTTPTVVTPSVTRSTTYRGFYSTSQNYAFRSSTAGYVYAKTSSESAYQKMTQSKTTSVTVSFPQDTSTTSLYKTYYGTVVTNDYSSSTYSGSLSHTTFYVPRFAFQAYSGSPTAFEIDSYNYATPKPEQIPVGYTFQGWATSSSSYTVDYSGASWSPDYDGRVRYAVFKKTTAAASVTLNNQGTTTTASKETATYLYGTGSTTPGSSSYTNCTNPSRSGYDFLGWSTSSSSTSATYDNAQEALDAGYSGTLYAVFRKDFPGTEVTLNANGGQSNYTTAEKIITPIYLYGNGNSTGGNTAYYPSSSVIPTRSGCDFLGWSTSPSATYVSYDSTIEALDAGYTGTLYAVWEQNGGVRIYTSSTSSSLYAVYIYNDSSWGYYAPYVYNGNSWQGTG